MELLRRYIEVVYTIIRKEDILHDREMKLFLSSNSRSHALSWLFRQQLPRFHALLLSQRLSPMCYYITRKLGFINSSINQTTWSLSIITQSYNCSRKWSSIIQNGIRRASSLSPPPLSWLLSLRSHYIYRLPHFSTCYYRRRKAEWRHAYSKMQLHYVSQDGALYVTSLFGHFLTWHLKIRFPQIICICWANMESFEKQFTSDYPPHPTTSSYWLPAADPINGKRLVSKTIDALTRFLAGISAAIVVSAALASLVKERLKQSTLVRSGWKEEVVIS